MFSNALILYLSHGHQIVVYFVNKQIFLLLSWPHLFWEIFALNWQTFTFFIHHFQNIFIKLGLISSGGK